MSETQIAAIFGMVQRLERKLDSTLKEFSDRLAALEETSGSGGSETETSTDGPSLATICEDLAILGSAIGSVHAAVSSGEPLPDYILEHRSMARFVDNYPDRAAPPFNVDRRNEELAKMATMSRTELEGLKVKAMDIIANPEASNRQRYNARTFLPQIEDRLRTHDRER